MQELQVGVEVCPPPFVVDEQKYEERCELIRRGFYARYDLDVLRRDLFERQDGLCRLCEKPLQDSSGFFTSIDHGFSISHFGKSSLPAKEAEELANEIDNLYAVHPSCNSSKNFMNIDEWDAGNYGKSIEPRAEDYYRIEQQRRHKVSKALSEYYKNNPTAKEAWRARVKSLHANKNDDGKSVFAIRAGRSSFSQSPKDSKGRPLSLLKAIAASHTLEAKKRRSERIRGTKRSTESRTKQSKTLRTKFAGKPVPHLSTPEVNKKKAAAKLGKPGAPWTESQRKKFTASNSGEKNHFYGKHHSEESRRKISETKFLKTVAWG